MNHEFDLVPEWLPDGNKWWRAVCLCDWCSGVYQDIARADKAGLAHQRTMKRLEAQRGQGQ